MLIILAVVVTIVVVGAFLWTARGGISRWIKEQISASLKTAQEDFLTLASQRLATERAQQSGEMDLRKAEVKRAVEGLEQQLTKYEQLLRDVEKDRATKYGSLERQLTTAMDETQKLHQTTAQLTAMLGNAKIRGQWGEKTADDILRLCGLQEGIHYLKQRNAPIGRPDFTFLLPDDRKCYMDVKFPLDNYVKLSNSDRDEEQRTHKEQFLRDVRAHMKELERRDYAPTNENAPDYVLMFIPNEQVYGAINEWMPGLIDEGMKKRVILCGPWTLYANVRLIWENWQNFYHAQTIGDIAKTVSEFLKDYERFKERFKDLGAKLEGARQKYEEITTTSYAQLNRRIDRIEEYRKGEGVLPAPPVTEPLEALPVKELIHD